MKKLFTVLLLLVFSLLLTGCIGGSGQQDSSAKPASPESQAKQPEPPKQEQESYKGSLEKIMDLGMALKCSWKMDDNYYGTAWVKGENSYSEVYNEGQTGKVIVKDNCMWSWGDTNQGVKVCFQSEDPMDLEGEEIQEEAPQEMEVEEMRPPQDVDYNCQPAAFGDDKFNPPNEVEFIDMDQMMQGVMPEGY